MKTEDILERHWKNRLRMELEKNCSKKVDYILLSPLEDRRKKG